MITQTGDGPIAAITIITCRGKGEVHSYIVHRDYYSKGIIPFGDKLAIFCPSCKDRLVFNSFGERVI